MLIRPMRAEDIPAARDLSSEAIRLVRAQLVPAAGIRSSAPPSASSGDSSGTPDPNADADADPARALREARWDRRAAFFLDNDPAGSWVAANDDGTVVGVAMSLRREKLWALSALFVRPDHQGAGVGKALLSAALGYSEGCLRGLLISTEDPRAARRYRAAGFTLHPTIRTTGVVDRAALPVVEGVRAGDLGDRDLADSVDRRTRGAAHGPDHAYFCDEYAMLVCDLLTGSGYCYVDETGSPIVLAATNRKVAVRLLWSALARSPLGATVHIDFLTPAQEWALDIALAAGLVPRTEGYLALRHMRPPEPYLPSGAFL